MRFRKFKVLMSCNMRHTFRTFQNPEPDYRAPQHSRQALDRFLGGVKLVLERKLTEGSGSGTQSEEETTVGMLQRVLHPRLKSQLSESNLAVRQVWG